MQTGPRYYTGKFSDWKALTGIIFRARLKQVSFMAKVTLEQKKLEMIKKQLYGKPQPTVTPIRAQNSNIKAPSFNNVSEVSYLYHDLKKIVLLGSLAVFIQLGLFFLVRINLVSLSY